MFEFLSFFFGIPTASALESCQNTHNQEPSRQYISLTVPQDENISSLDILYQNTSERKNFVTYNARINAKNNSEIVFTRSASDDVATKTLYSDIFIGARNAKTNYIDAREKQIRNCQNIYTRPESIYAGGENLITWKSYDNSWGDNNGIDFYMPANIDGPVMMSFEKKYSDKQWRDQGVKYFIPQFRIYTQDDTSVVKTFDISEKNIDAYLGNDMTASWCYGDICTIKFSREDVKKIISVHISEADFPYAVMEKEWGIKKIIDNHNQAAKIFQK